jgi:hypothetical protein
VVSSLLKVASFLCAVVLVLSFAAFTSDQAGSGSKATVAKIANADASEQPPQITNVDTPSPNARVERVREEQHSALREKLDDANDALVAPFKSATGSKSIWTQRIVSSLLAFVVFALGLGYLSRLAALRGI